MDYGHIRYSSRSMANKAWPKSPQKLLEARYQAYQDGDVDYILESIHPKKRDQHQRDSVAAWAKSAKFLALNIESVQEDGDQAWIDFSVQYEQDGNVTDHVEKAEFQRADDRWYYFDSTYPKGQTIRREAPKVGRNDPCPCGSGKKYKKCHGA